MSPDAGSTGIEPAPARNRPPSLGCAASTPGREAAAGTGAVAPAPVGEAAERAHRLALLAKAGVEDPTGVVFAAKTTASGLLALLVAFRFNLDQPQWCLLTVFIVAQPQSGMVLAKSFHRIVGTVIGAAMALVFVGGFAQERVLFLGALSLWIGLCTFGSQYFRNFTAYGWVLSGYTAAIVGIPAALDPNNAFYTAQARVTEISLGIIVTATISHIVLPSSLAARLWQAVAASRQMLAEYAAALAGGDDVAPLRATLLAQAAAIETLRASAVFEDPAIRVRSSWFRRIGAALVCAASPAATVDERPAAIGVAAAAIKAWCDGAIDAGELRRRLSGAAAGLPTIRTLCRDPSLPHGELFRRVAADLRTRDLLAALVDYAEASEAALCPEERRDPDFRHRTLSDPMIALWTGLRAGVAVFLVSTFWILADWAHGSTATVLAAIATARLATMAPAVPIAAAANWIFVLAAIPAFLVIDVLLPHADGFAGFALAVGPMLFLFAVMMAHPRTRLIGFFAALLFASVGQFQNRMVYDPVGLINTVIAAVAAASTAMVLWAVIAPDTPAAARRRFARAARRALEEAVPGGRKPVAAFETAVAEALAGLQNHLDLARPEDRATLDSAMAVVSAGRALSRLPGDDRRIAAPAALERAAALATDARRAALLERARRAAEASAEESLAQLRRPDLDERAAQAAAARLGVLAVILDGIERRRAAPARHDEEPERSHAA